MELLINRSIISFFDTAPPSQSHNDRRSAIIPDRMVPANIRLFWKYKLSKIILCPTHFILFNKNNDDAPNIYTAGFTTFLIYY